MLLNQDEQYRLHLGDCADVMAGMDEDCIDMTVTSPPYDNLRSYAKSELWCANVWRAVLFQLLRITKPGGVVVWVVGDATINGSETGTSFRQALHAKDIGFRLHDTMIYKREGPPLTHNRYEQKFEYMFILSNGRPNTFNGIREECKYAGSSRSSITMRQDSDSLGDRSATGCVQPTKLRGNVVEYAVGYNGNTTDKIAHKHPAIFPESLARDHIITWSNKGDIVLDPFMGSGTSGKMAIEHGRKFIGIERVSEYYKIAQKRISALDTIA